MNKQFYLDIKNRIDTVLADDVKHSGLWNNQFNNESKEKPFHFPVIFVEFSDMQFRSEAYGVQKTDFEITLHIGFSKLVEDIDMLDLIQLVAQTFHGWNGTDFTDWTRIEEIQDIDHDRVIDWQMVFRTTFTDCTTAKVRKLVETTPTILEVDKELIIDNDVIKTGVIPD